MIWLLFVALGLVFGSFGSVLVTRLPAGESLGGRSRCPRCGRTLGVADLLPVLSFLFLRGRCRGCRTGIPLLYPLLEITSALLFAAAQPSLSLALALWAMLLIAVVDARTQRIPDLFTIIAAGSALLFHAFNGSFSVALLLSATLGAGFFALQWVLSRGAWIGSGDILLAGAIGLLLGDWRTMLLALLLSYIIGGIVAAGVLIRKGRAARTMKIAFGPFLVIGGAIALLWGKEMLRLFV